MSESDTRGQKSDPTDSSSSTESDINRNAVVTDGGVAATDLTQFQTSILAILAEEARYGLAIKRDLETYYGEEVNHGRLYPNLDDLVEMGLVEKSELDKRTNQYTLTSSGAAVLRDHVSWQLAKLEGEDYELVETDRALATDGGDA